MQICNVLKFFSFCIPSVFEFLSSGTSQMSRRLILAESIKTALKKNKFGVNFLNGKQFTESEMVVTPGDFVTMGASGVETDTCKHNGASFDTSTLFAFTNPISSSRSPYFCVLRGAKEVMSN